MSVKPVIQRPPVREPLEIYEGPERGEMLTYLIVIMGSILLGMVLLFAAGPSHGKPEQHTRVARPT